MFDLVKPNIQVVAQALKNLERNCLSDLHYLSYTCSYQVAQQKST